MTLPDSYPVPRRGLAVHLTTGECTLFQAVRGDDLPRSSFGFATYNQWKVPHTVARYLISCDGRTKHGEIAAQFCGEACYSHFGQILAEQAVAALTSAAVVDVSDAAADYAPAVTVTGAFDSYAPLHISFEITDTCNFRCHHCYVSASPEKHGRKNGAGTMKMLDNLAASGVRVVELTGGECTTHPEFKEILDHASRKFDLVGVISNGYLLGKRADLARFVAGLPNVVVQISIDGDREYHDKFRVMPGSFDAACQAIRILKSFGTFIRVGMTVTRENLDQVAQVFHLVKDLGVDAFAVAATTSFGRGADVTGCSEVEHWLNHQLERILEPFASDPLFDAVRRERETAAREKAINCGAGWRSFALNSDGNVRSCLFLADSKKFGNLDRQNYQDVFRQPDMRLFHDAPSPGTDQCRGPQRDGTMGCKHLSTCIGCFAKAFRVSETVFPECPWRKKYFPGMSLTVSDGGKLISVEQLLSGTVTA